MVDTAPKADTGTGAGARDPVTLPRLGPIGTLRWIWRQLTSMRTALFLLLLLAVAAVPGSVLPQTGQDAAKVTLYLQDHRTIGPWLNRIGAFDVYSSVWFSAIYLLLFVSLVGCVVPRSIQMARTIRHPPPRTPRRPERLPESATVEIDRPLDRASAAKEVAEALRRRHYRVQIQEDGAAVAGECGHTREIGNLIFHLSLVGLLLAVAAGHLWGWRGDVIVPVGSSATDTPGVYNTVDLGPWVNGDHLPDFTVRVDAMHVTFQTSGNEVGAPSEFAASVSVQHGSGPFRPQRLAVNHPLTVDGAKVYLLGNGYAPVITVRDSTGKVVYDQATVFLPQDSQYRSIGVVKATAAQPQPIGLIGSFLPTAQLTSTGQAESAFPALDNPVLVLSAYEGNMQLTASPSVYTLDTSKMTPLLGASGGPILLLKPGQTAQLKGGKGSVTFDGVQRYAGLTMRYDPGKDYALLFSLLAILGVILSLSVRRRRVFVRLDPATAPTADPSADPVAQESGADPAGTGRTVVRIGGLARGEDSGLAEEIEGVRTAVVARLEGTS